MKSIYIIIFVVFSCNLGNAQESSLLATSSMDGCVYFNEIERKIIISDKVYSDELLENEEIIFNNNNASEYDDVFDTDDTKKYTYYYTDTIKTDSLGDFSISEKLAISKTEPILNSKWTLIDFELLDTTKEFLLEDCKEVLNNQKYNKSIIINDSNKSILFYIDINNNKAFKLISTLNCSVLHYFVFDKKNIMFKQYGNNLTFMHSGESLYILQY